MWYITDLKLKWKVICLFDTFKNLHDVQFVGYKHTSSLAETIAAVLFSTFSITWASRISSFRELPCWREYAFRLSKLDFNRRRWSLFWSIKGFRSARRLDFRQLIFLFCRYFCNCNRFVSESNNKDSSFSSEALLATDRCWFGCWIFSCSMLLLVTVRKTK